MRVLDDGRLTDGQGRTVDFRNTVVIMTSNLGSDLIQERFGELDYAHMKELVLGVVSHNFRPEFINRIDEVRWSSIRWVNSTLRRLRRFS